MVSSRQAREVRGSPILPFVVEAFRIGGDECLRDGGKVKVRFDEMSPWNGSRYLLPRLVATLPRVHREKRTATSVDNGRDRGILDLRPK